MIEYNYQQNMEEVKTQMTSWLKRSLTVLGRITVAKSLLVSNLNYLLLSVPKPDPRIMKDIHSSFFKFIWYHKPDKISRTQLSQIYEEGGAKMIDIDIHAQSLNVSWIRRDVFLSLLTRILAICFFHFCLIDMRLRRIRVLCILKN